MDDEKLPPKQVLLDETAESANPELPAFLARPEGAPVYHGFGLVEETRTDGWCFGAITDFLEPDSPDGCEWGDGFVVAPDGSGAGIVWATDVEEMHEVLPPDGGRWGVYGVKFSRPVKTIEDLVFNFRQILPDLKNKYEEINAPHPKAVWPEGRIQTIESESE